MINSSNIDQWIRSGEGSCQSHLILDGSLSLSSSPTGTCLHLTSSTNDQHQPYYAYNPRLLQIAQVCHDCFLKLPDAQTRHPRCIECGTTHHNPAPGSSKRKKLYQSHCRECNGPKVKFGRHRGSYIGEIRRSDPSYYAWLITIVRDDQYKKYVAKFPK